MNTEEFVRTTVERLRIAPEFVLSDSERALRARLGDDDEAWFALESILTAAHNNQLVR